MDIVREVLAGAETSSQLCKRLGTSRAYMDRNVAALLSDGILLGDPRRRLDVTGYGVGIYERLLAVDVGPYADKKRGPVGRILSFLALYNGESAATVASMLREPYRPIAALLVRHRKVWWTSQRDSKNGVMGWVLTARGLAIGRGIWVRYLERRGDA